MQWGNDQREGCSGKNCEITKKQISNGHILGNLGFWKSLESSDNQKTEAELEENIVLGYRDRDFFFYKMGVRKVALYLRRKIYKKSALHWWWALLLLHDVPHIPGPWAKRGASRRYGRRDVVPDGKRRTLLSSSMVWVRLEGRFLSRSVGCTWVVPV